LQHHVETLDAGSMVQYDGRLVGITRVPIPLAGDSHGYAYVAVDYERRRQEWKKCAQAQQQGFFVLICSEKVEPAEMLPLYYTRQAVEQIF